MSIYEDPEKAASGLENSELTVEPKLSELTVGQKLEDQPTFPEGGLQAWLTIAGA
jgi:hypothetical protein